MLAVAAWQRAAPSHTTRRGFFLASWYMRFRDEWLSIPS